MNNGLEVQFIGRFGPSVKRGWVRIRITNKTDRTLDEKILAFVLWQAKLSHKELTFNPSTGDPMLLIEVGSISGLVTRKVSPLTKELVVNELTLLLSQALDETPKDEADIFEPIDYTKAPTWI